MSGNLFLPGLDAPIALDDAIPASQEVKALGQYPTPFWVAEALVGRHFPKLDTGDMVIEPSCGPGAFLAAIPEHVPAMGIDIDAKMVAVARQNTGRPVLQGDFANIPLNVTPTVILGNPPFNLSLIDRFLDRAYELLPEGGRCGLLLPSYAFQTASRVAGYADRWSLFQEMIPRNVFPGLSIPLLFALFGKDRQRTMIGFALYREAADVQRLAQPYRGIVAGTGGSVWRRVVEAALRALGGEGDLQDIYRELEHNRPFETKFWREEIRRTVRRYAESFLPLSGGRYRLVDRSLAAAA